MTAAYRLKGIGWFMALAAVALGFYLISLQVAAERKKLDDVTARVTDARHEIHALETEFATRANMRQLEQWNGDTLALAAPTAAQFVSDDAALAALDPAHPAQPVQAAQLIVPALSTPATVEPAVVPAAPPPATAAAPLLAVAVQHAALRIDPPARVRMQTVALVDRQLLSSTTFGDIASGARREARR